VSVIVDAIDECEQTTRERFLQDVLNLIGKSSSNGSHAPCIKFLITSGPLLGRHYATNLLQIDQDYVEQDLRLVIQAKVEGIAQRTRCKPDVRRYLENALFSKADCTFLWVTLVLHLLEESLLASQKDFKRIIDEVPNTLTATYERFLQRIPIEYQTLAIRLLHFLVGSLRPLTLDEVRILIATQRHHGTLAAVEEDAQPNVRETIEGVLGPLVRIWDNRIYLVHQSLKEFLISLSNQTDNPLSATYGVDLRRASLLLAEVCVTYLLLDDFKQDLFSRDQSDSEISPTSPVKVSTDGSVEQSWDPFDLEEDSLFKDPAVLEAEACALIGAKYMFFDYSARHWAEHFSSACSISTFELQESVILLSDASSSRGLNWFRFYWLQAAMNLLCPRDFIPFVAASYFGHLTSLKTLLRKGLPIESKVGIRGLYWASRKGHHEVVDLLLRENYNPDVKVLDGQNAFIAAVSFDHLDVVKRLSEDEDFISQQKESRVNHTATGGRTPLSIAAGNGFVEVVRQLLQHSRIQPDIADFDHWTPLFWAISGKHLDVAKLLLTDSRVSINRVDRSGRNVLSWAASGGELELVKYLMSLKDLNANETDRNGRTPLSWAAGNGHLETTIYLRRSQRIDFSRKDKDGRNAISWACSGGHHEVVEYLIKHDYQGVDEEDGDGWTPLAWALFNQAPKTVQVLLDSGLVDVNKKDRNGRSALSFAAGYGYLDVLRLLLNTKDIDIENKDNDGRTPLSYATPYPDIVELLQQLHN
jgi:ankyrin repeat protein